MALAKISENGVWITSVNIGDSGTRVAIEGRSLNLEGAVRYAQRVGDQLGPFGVKFATLEISSQAAGSDRIAIPVVKFVLR
jgi:hypothetical protein